MRLLTSLTVCIVPCLLTAQADVVAGGGDGTGMAGSTCFTVGQVAVGSYTGSSGTVQEGVQQAYINPNTIVPEGKMGIATLLPNPTSASLLLTLDEPPPASLRYQVIDGTGRVVMAGIIAGPSTAISVQPLSAGAYHLLLHTDAALLRDLPFLKTP